MSMLNVWCTKLRIMPCSYYYYIHVSILNTSDFPLSIAPFLYIVIVYQSIAVYS